MHTFKKENGENPLKYRPVPLTSKVFTTQEEICRRNFCNKRQVEKGRPCMINPGGLV